MANSKDEVRTIIAKTILSTTVVWDDDTLHDVVISLSDVTAMKPYNEGKQTVIYGSGIDGWIISESFFILRTIWQGIKGIQE